MAKLNPIINQAPKKLDVPEFNKKEIVKIVQETVGAGGDGGITVPTFTPTTFEIDLPDVDIVLSQQDCADIIENQYPIITISHAVSAEETISLTFVRNNSVSGIEKGKPFINLQYDLVADDDEDTYLIGLSFSDNDVKSWSMKIAGGEGGNGATKGTINLTNSNDEWTQAQLEDVYTNKYDIVNVLTSSNTTVLRKVSEYQGFGVLYWTFMPQQGIVINIFAYDQQDGYTIQIQNRMPLVTMDVDGSAIMSQDQTTLQEIYEKQPDILYVDAGNDGEQSYKKQYARDDTISYSCFIPAVLASVKIIEDRNVTPHTYSVYIERYDLSSLLVSNN